jgi:hypothetical protein
MGRSLEGFPFEHPDRDGRELGRYLLRELCRQFERLDVVHLQLKALKNALRHAASKV